MPIKQTQLVSLETALNLLHKYKWSELYDQFGEESFYIKDTPYSFYVVNSGENTFNVNVGVRTDYHEIDMEETCATPNDFLLYIKYDLCWKENDIDYTL